MLLSNYSDIDNRTVFDDVYIRAQVLWGQFELGFFILGTPANIIVILLCLRILRRSRNTNNNQYFVLSMAVADLLANTIHSPLVFYHYALGKDIGDLGCWLFYILTYFSWISSSLSLVCLNLDKCLYFARPLHYRYLARKKYVIIGVSLCWGLGLFFTLLYISLGTTFRSESCIFVPRHKEFYIATFIISFLIPVLVSCAVSIAIAFIVVNFNRNLTKRSTRKTGIPATDRGTRLVRSLFFVFSTTIWTALTTLPYRIAYIFTLSTPNETINHATVFLIFGLLILLGMNSVGNPFIAVCTQKLYRRQIRDIFGVSRNKRRPNLNVSTVHISNASSYQPKSRKRGTFQHNENIPSTYLKIYSGIGREANRISNPEIFRF